MASISVPIEIFVTRFAEALRLSPRDPGAFAWMGYAGMSKNVPGSYEQAVAWFRRSIEANPNFPHAFFHLYKFLFDLTDGGSWPLKVMRRWVAPPQRPGEIFRARAGARQGRFAWGAFRSTTCPD